MKHGANFLPGIAWAEGEFLLLTAELLLLVEFDRVSGLCNELRAGPASWDAFLEKSGRTSAEFAPIALIRLGKVAPKLTGESANGSRKSFHASNISILPTSLI